MWGQVGEQFDGAAKRVGGAGGPDTKNRSVEECSMKMLADYKYTRLQHMQGG